MDDERVNAPDDNVLESARQLLDEMSGMDTRPPYARFIPIILLMGYVAIVFLILFITETPKELSTSSTTIKSPSLLSLPGSPTKFVTVQPGLEKQDDIFLCDAVTHCMNISSSPNATEKWPVLDSTGNYIAYYSIGQRRTDLLVVTLPQTMSLPVEVMTVTNGLNAAYSIVSNHAPAFSPDGIWLALLVSVNTQQAFELFAISVDAKRVVQITNLGLQIDDYIWSGNKTLLLKTSNSDDEVAYWQAEYENGYFSLKHLY